MDTINEAHTGNPKPDLRIRIPSQGADEDVLKTPSPSSLNMRVFLKVINLLCYECIDKTKN